MEPKEISLLWKTTCSGVSAVIRVDASVTALELLLLMLGKLFDGHAQTLINHRHR